MRGVINFVCTYELVCTSFNGCFWLNPDYRAILLVIVLFIYLRVVETFLWEFKFLADLEMGAKGGNC